MFSIEYGWWGIPFGPGACYKVIKNNKTGNDISADIFENLTESGFKKRTVTITKINDIFAPIEKDIIKEVKKSIDFYTNKGGNLTESPIIGFYIDTERPHYLIGLNSDDLKNLDDIRLALRKYFYKNVQFEFIDINQENDVAQKLKSQGQKI